MVRAGTHKRTKAVRRITNAGLALVVILCGAVGIVAIADDGQHVRVAWSEKLGAEVYASNENWCSDNPELHVKLEHDSVLISSQTALNAFDSVLRRALLADCAIVRAAVLTTEIDGTEISPERVLLFENDVDTQAQATGSRPLDHLAATSSVSGFVTAEHVDGASITDRTPPILAIKSGVSGQSRYHADRRVRLNFPDTMLVQPAALKATVETKRELRIPLPVLSQLALQHTRKTSGHLRSDFMRRQIHRTVRCAEGEPLHGTNKTDAMIDDLHEVTWPITLSFKMAAQVIPDGEERYVFRPFEQKVIWTVPELPVYCQAPGVFSRIRAVTARFDDSELISEFVPDAAARNAWLFRINAQGGDVILDIDARIERLELEGSTLSLLISPERAQVVHVSGRELMAITQEEFSRRREFLADERTAQANQRAAAFEATIAALRGKELSRPARIALAFHGFEGEGIPPTPHPADAAAQASLFGVPTQGYFMFRVAEIDGAHAIVTAPLSMRVVPTEGRTFTKERGMSVMVDLRRVRATTFRSLTCFLLGSLPIGYMPAIGHIVLKQMISVFWKLQQKYAWEQASAPRFSTVSRPGVNNDQSRVCRTVEAEAANTAAKWSYVSSVTGE